jgi:hypothetical protein
MIDEPLRAGPLVMGRSPLMMARSKPESTVTIKLVNVGNEVQQLLHGILLLGVGPRVRQRLALVSFFFEGAGLDL